MLKNQHSCTDFKLSPTQERARREVVAALGRAAIVALWGDVGRGKSTIVQSLCAEQDGVLIRARDVVNAVGLGHPLAIEEAIFRCIADALDTSNIVFVDDFDAVTGCLRNCSFYPRSGWFEGPALGLAQLAIERSKKLVIAGANLPDGLRNRAAWVKVEKLCADDYAHICRAALGRERLGRVQFERVHRFAPNLNGHHLRDACAWFHDQEAINTDAVIGYFRAKRLLSNVALDEVAEVDLNSLRGIDDVIEALETNVVLPLEHDELVERYQLRSKRGVLLAGPPGTGKTTIGRALARRLRGKFLLIDGTVIAGTSQFYSKVEQIFTAAQENAPAVIFIDDGDVLFEDPENVGLYRYLLTKLDGLESEKAGHVCVMMTAMDVGSLPPALVRSGRIELWLRMRLPDDAARSQILSDLIAPQASIVGDFDLASVVAHTGDFTGADLKRTVEDAKLLLARDAATGTEKSGFTEYLLRAAQAARENKELYAEAVQRARAPMNRNDSTALMWAMRHTRAGQDSNDDQ